MKKSFTGGHQPRPSSVSVKSGAMKKTFLILGLLAAIGFLTVGVLVSGVLRSGSSSNSEACLSPGTWRLEKVYLDSMLYVNGSEAQLLQRLDVTEMFAQTAPVTLAFDGDVGQRIYKGTVRIQYGSTGYGVQFKVNEGSRERSECHRGMRLDDGRTMQDGAERMDTIRDGNQILIGVGKNQGSRNTEDHAGTYRLSNDTLYHSYTPIVWPGGAYAADFNAAKWKAGTLFHKDNPVGSKFANYRNGNKVFRFVWVRVK